MRHGALPFVALLFWAEASAAQSPTTLNPASDSAPVHVVRVVLEGEALGCALQPPLEERIRSRSARLAFNTSAPTAIVTARVHEPAPLQPHSALLTIRTSDGRPPYVRAIAADSCDELLDAMAVVAAVRLDPPAAPRPDLQAEPRPRDAGAGTVAPTPATSTPGEGADNGAAWAWAFGVGAGGAFAYGPTPDGLPGVALWVGFEAISDEATVAFRPAVRLTGAYLAQSGIQGERGQATVILATARLELCPVSQRFTEWGWLLCGFGEFGELQARGRRTYEAAELRRPWRVVGGSAVFSYRPLAGLTVDATLALGSTLTRYAYQLAEEVVHETPPLTGSVLLGAGWTWE